PAKASASNKRSPLGVNGISMLVLTSPTIVTFEALFLVTLTTTCGWFAFPFRWLTILASIPSVGRPLTTTLPANGMAIVPSEATICAGSVTLFDALLVAGDADAVAPNNMAGGASQIVTSTTSPEPIR